MRASDFVIVLAFLALASMPMFGAVYAFRKLFGRPRVLASSHSLRTL
jgi:hypothetical protein